jgi:peptidoglycan/xylan/chitin deacetylase (PgdA/CDA1 family)
VVLGGSVLICFTGDVHHTSLRINDQRFIDLPHDSEVKIAQRYVSLFEKYGVKVTLYVCGKCFTEEWDDLRPTVRSALVEVGAHGYRARQPRPLFDWYGRRTGNWNGPRWFQEWDIRRNVEACEEKISYRPISWRAHSYKVDTNTVPLLAKYGFKLVSDEIRRENIWPERVAHGLISHPLNTIPDHDHIYHAHRTEEFVSRANASGYGADEFGAVSYLIEEWGRLVLEQAEAIEARGGIATILAHPLCMYLADRFATLERLLSAFSNSRCIWAREILDLLDGRFSGGNSRNLVA